MLKQLFRLILLVTIVINVICFVTTIGSISNSGQVSSFLEDIKSNLMKSPIFDIFASRRECKTNSNEYLLGYFEGTSSGCDCR